MRHLFESMQGPKQSGLASLALTVMMSLLFLTQTDFARQVSGSNQPTQTAFNYQGRLEQDGVPADGAYDFQFTLYSNQAGAEKLVSCFKRNVAVARGAFIVELDFGATIPYKEENWLEIAVRPRTLEADYPYSNLLPRQALRLVKAENEGSSKRSASAAVSGESMVLTPVALQESSGWTRDKAGLRLTIESDNVGIGTKAPRAKLDVEGDIHVSGPIRSGNSLVFNGVTHEITATTTPTNPATSKQMFLGLDPTSGPNFFDISVGIGTKTTNGAKLRVFSPQTPNIALSSSQPGPGVKATLEFGVATCPSCYSTIATPGDVVIRGDADDTEDVIIAARSWTANPLAGAIRFTTGTPATEAERMTILRNGFVGIGTKNPPSMFGIGNGNPFQVDSSGDIVRIKNVQYSWPSSGGVSGSVLTYSAGNLTWAPASGGVSGSCGSGLNFVTKWSSTSAVTCSQIFDTGARIGIGTTTPATRLNVTDNIFTSGLAAVQVDFTNSTSSSSALGIDVNSPSVASKRANTGMRARTSINVPGGFAGAAEGRLSEVASFNAFGRLVGVTGISAPSNLLAGAPSAPSFAVGGLFQNLPASPPTFSAVGPIWVGGVYGEIANTFNANPPSGAIAAVIGVDNSNGTANHLAGYFAGKVRVTSLAGGPNQSLCISPTGVLSSCTSDRRLKMNIRPLANVLEKVAEIRGVSFNWIEFSKDLVASTAQRSIGVIAQEVEAVFPEAVTSSDNGYKAVDYNALTAVLLQAVKELKMENGSLKQRIEALERAAVK